MKVMRESRNEARWPRTNVKTVDCRKRDLVIRITDWMKDKEEPAYDVECYISGVYDWHESKSFTIHEHKDKATCKQLAVVFAQAQLEKLL